jgi:hypothetical protein
VRNANDLYAPARGFTPLNLSWSYTGETYMKQIPPLVEKHIDLFYVYDPRFDVETGFEMNPAPPPRGIMAFAHQPNVHPILEAGARYRISLVVAAENAPAQYFLIDLELPVGVFEHEGVRRAAEVLRIHGLSH